MNVMDPEVTILTGISAELHADYQNELQQWAGSPFAWIKSKPSRQVGAIGEKLVARWLLAHRFKVARSPSSDADRLIEGRPAEIKFSSLWANGNYKFQQLRDQKYDFAICLGISPFDAHCWVIPKADILRLWKDEHRISSQHGGSAGNDTAWIDVHPDTPPDWLQPYGGTLAHALVKLAEITGGPTGKPQGQA